MTWEQIQMKYPDQWVGLVDVRYQNDDGISVEFPDLPGCLTCGDTIEEAIQRAKEAMGLYLYGMEIDGDEIPNPTPIKNIEYDKTQALILIEIYMPICR